jgi:hypothetical protein
MLKKYYVAKRSDEPVRNNRFISGDIIFVLAAQNEYQLLFCLNLSRLEQFIVSGFVFDKYIENIDIVKQQFT